MRRHGKTSHLQPSKSGFTLAEVLIATALTVIVMSAVLGTVFITLKSGFGVGQYTEMENESRQALELFGRDVRMAEGVAWTDANTITLTVPTSMEGTATEIYTYQYRPDTGELWRTADGNSRCLVSGIQALAFMGYQMTGEPVFTSSTIPTTTYDWQVASSSIKQLELTVSSVRQRSTIKTTQKIISARFILRNKHTS